MLNFTRILLLGSLLFSSVSVAQIDIQSFMQELPQGSSLGFVAKNIAQNEVIAQYNSQAFMLPASTQKVFTALAAKLALGDQFRFETSALTNGKIQNRQLNGDLIIKFSGDPNLTSGQLYNLLAQLKQQGIDQINGNLILDTSVFTGHDRGLGWIWNDLAMCFNAPPAAVNIDNNCFHVDLDANLPVGETVKINIPSRYPIQVFGQVRIATKEEAAYCQLDAVVHDSNRYQLKGCITRQSKPFGLSFAVQDPDAYATAIIQRQLKQLKIEFNGKVQQPFQPQTGQILAQHFSSPLPDLLKRMMKKSDNQIADALFRSVAYQLYKRPASFQSGAAALKQVLSNQAGIRFGNSIIADGSGLSRHNLIDPQTMLQTLEYIIQNEDKLHLMETFPIAGVDGTISGRGAFLKEPLAKNLAAKTGALKGVYNLAGFMTNARGETIAFIQFINGYSTGEFESQTKRAPLVQFESKLYNALYAE